MIVYILQVILFQLLFLLVYEVLLKKETFFTYNRWYLLATSVISLLLPMVKIGALTFLVPAESIPEISTVWLPEVIIGDVPAATQAVNIDTSNEMYKINWWLIAYGAGVVASLLIFFRKYQNLNRLFRFRAITAERDMQIIEVPNSTIACTFYKTIFLGDQLSEAERQQILSHELVHVKQKHSLDLVFFEVFKIIFWFNPLIYIYQSRIATLHEFIADAVVVKTTEKRSYYEQLLNSAFNTQNISFINQFFNHSLIKKRIVMLQKSRSKTISKLKFLVLVPLMLLMLTYVACSDDADPAAETSSEKLLEKNELSQYSYTLGKYEEMSVEKRQIHDKYEEFLTNNPDYVSWATIKGNEISYAVHSKKEEVPDGYIKLQVSDKYDMYINLPNNGNKTTTTKLPNTADIIQDGADVPFAVVEQVPVFPGCEDLSSNEERKACMSEKVKNFVNSSFSTALGKELGLTGVNRIITIFRIDAQGQVTDVRARAPHPDLEAEAIKVISGLPQMTPGKHNGVETNVTYSLPIVFQVGK